MTIESPLLTAPGALEKILRLLQSISQIFAAYASTAEDAKIFWLLRRQFALGSSLASDPLHYRLLSIDV
jgi:hypothetical protein